jgi:hypothetical protein
MTEEEWKAWEIQRAGQMRIMQTHLPAPVTQRLDWLEADSADQRTAILKLEREVKRLRIGGAIVAAVAGFLLGRVFL